MEEVNMKDAGLEPFVNAREQFGRTPLFYAVKSRCKQTIELLLENKASLKITAEKSRSVLHFLLEDAGDEEKTTEIFQLLLSKNAPTCIIDSDGKTILHLAAKSKLKSVMLELVPRMVKLLSTVDNTGKTSLHCLLEALNYNEDDKFVDVVRLILEANPTVAIIHDKYGHTLLHLAAKNKLKEIAKVLIPYVRTTDKH